MIGALLVMVLASQPQPSTEGEARWRAAEPVLRQMIGEADGAIPLVDYRGAAWLTVRTRGRASDEGGVCAREELRIEMEGATAPLSTEEGTPARIRRVEAEPQFHILKTRDGQPRWDVVGDTLERACADPDAGGYDWITAESAEDAKAAVLGLLAVRIALGEAASPLIRVRCGHPADCLARGDVRAQIEPFDSNPRNPLRSSRCGGARRYRCQVFFVADMPRCQIWHLEMETAWEAPYRVRSATFVDRGAVLHCGDAAG